MSSISRVWIPPSKADPEYTMKYLNSFYSVFGYVPSHIPITSQGLDALQEYIVDQGGVTLTLKGGFVEAHTPENRIKYGDYFGGAMLSPIH